MKKLEELGISPAPWKVDDGKWGCDNKIMCEYISDIIVKGEKSTKVVASCNAHFDTYKPDARLIAAAPELYEALFEALPWLTDIGAEVVGNEAAAKIAAIVKKAKSALAKAAGEGDGDDK